MPIRRVVLGNTGEHVRDTLRELRSARGLSQAQLAAKAGLPSQSITEIENGARRVNVDDLTALCRALKVKPERLLGR